MKIKTQNLTGLGLDWAVGYARCCEANGGKVIQARDLMSAAIRNGMASPSTDWAHGGPIIEREGIETAPRYADDGKTITGWTAMMLNDARNPRPLIVQRGDSKLVAAMHCFAISRLGEEVEIPENLFSQP